jgi:DNA-binding beta-propeller fold protein YncE
MLMGLLLTGCSKPAGIIFEPLAKPIVWPPQVQTGENSQPSRIQYVGQIVSDADLKPAMTTMQSIGQTIFGKKETHTMLTPFAVCTNGSDRLFVADSNAQCVHVFDLNTRVYQRWTPPKDKPQFAQPVGIAFDPIGHIIVADSVAKQLFIFDEQGKFLNTVGKDILARPCGLTIHPNTRQLFVCDTGLHQVLVFTPDGQLMTRLGKRGSGNGQFNFPVSVAIGKQGQIYVCDALNFRVQTFNPDLTFKNTFGVKGDMPGTFSQPKSLAVDGDGHLYVLDAHFEAVQIFDEQHHILLSFGQEGHAPGEFWLPTNLFIDSNNRIWIADSYNRRVDVLDYLPLPEIAK